MLAGSWLVMYISPVAIGEVQCGTAQQRSLDSGFADSLTLWLNRLLDWYGDRILDIDVVTARRWGQLAAAVGNSSADLLIAATAREHGLTVVTRNVGHFEPTGVRVFNPFPD